MYSAFLTKIHAVITKSPAKLRPLYTRSLRGHSDRVNCIAVCADGEHVVSGSNDGTVKVWNWSTGQVISTFAHHSGDGKKTDQLSRVWSVALFSDGTRAVSVCRWGDKAMRIWRLDSGTEIRAFREDDYRVGSVAISPDDCTVALADSTKPRSGAIAGV